MPTVEAHVPTDRASRYLGQLCRHVGQMGGVRHQPPTHHGGQAPPAVQHADWSDTTGMIRFTQGVCRLWATADTLDIRIDADNDDALRQLQDAIGRRLGTIGRRGQLTVHWQQSTSAPESSIENVATTQSTDTVPPRQHSSLDARPHHGFHR